MARVAIDAMGGDHAPAVVIDGALLAADRFPELELLLVGPRERIEAHLAERGADPERFEIVHAPQVVEMGESPVVALRKKPHSSIREMIRLYKDGRCDAVFSAGNTGAVVAAATMGLGPLSGVRRAAIAVTFPMEKPVVLIDAGANVQPKPLHLFQYGVMAAEFASRVYGIESPRVGLLNIGAEEEKGNQLVKETRELFRNSSLNYVGNIEGRDIFHGGCSVVVCDGFVGNIVLKVSEGISEMIVQLFRKKIAAVSDKIGQSGPAHEALAALSTFVDYAEYGGAPLLGVNGIVIIGHGRSDEKAISNALRWGGEMFKARVNEFIVEALRPKVV